MKKTIFTLFTIVVLHALAMAQDHIVTAQGTSFTPQNLTINVGETVQWVNAGGFHNVNGSIQSFPSNPESFSSGGPANAPWTFSHTFDLAGTYDYQCDIHFSMGMVGSVTVMPASGSGDVVISEIMYNDPSSGTDQYEYIELYNNGATAVEMEGWQFTAGVTFTFPAFTLNPGEFAIVSVNSTAFESLFGIPAFQWDMNQALNNSGETIKLSDANGIVVDSVFYDDENGWDPAADGLGASLVLCDYGGDNNDPANWLAATTSAGVQINSTDVFANPGGDSGCSPALTFQLAGFSVPEADGQVEIAVILTGGNSNPTQVMVDVNASSTATNGADYNLTSPVTLTFDAGVTSDTQIVTVTLLDDAQIEGDETLVLNLLNPTNGANITTNGQFTLTIADNDALLAEPDAVTTDVNTPVTIDILANDFLFNGIISIEITLQPSNGTVTVNGLEDVTYTPDQDFCGTDVFTYEICDGSTCDAANVTVTIDCPTSYPQYDIATVTTVDNEGHPDSLDVTAELRGIVYGVDLQVNPNTVQVTLIDNTGGIALFSSNTFGINLVEGDEVVVRGTIDEFNCLTEIVADTFWVASTGNTLQSPTVVTSLDESTESELIQINNLTIVDPGQWGSGTSGFNVDVTNGVDTFVLRIDDAVDLFTMSAPTNPFHAVGIGGQFDSAPCDGGYQFLPRYVEDIMEFNATSENHLAQAIRFYPNPVSEVLYVEADLNISSVSLTNMLGQQMLRIENPGTTVNISELNGGMYLLTFEADGEQWTARFIKH